MPATYTSRLGVNSRIVRVLLALAAPLDLEIHQMDAKTAFLNGELEEEIYMEPPEDFRGRFSA